MKNNKIIGIRALALTGVLTLLAAATSQASVNVYFYEVGSRLHVEMVGTIAIDSSYNAQSSASAGNSFSLESNYLLLGPIEPTRVKFSNSGVFTTTSLDLSGSYSNADYGSITGGFYQNAVYLENSGTIIGSERILDFTGMHASVSGQTLASVGAASFSNTLAWTANTTGDTINYHTGTPPIPEPSTYAAIFGCLALGFAAIRRRK